jgi:hypothetical protein
VADAAEALTKAILREARLAVAAGLNPGEALGAVIAVAGILIGEVRDAALRGNYLQHAMAMLAKAVAHVSAKPRVPADHFVCTGGRMVQCGRSCRHCGARSAGEECRFRGWMQ